MISKFCALACFTIFAFFNISSVKADAGLPDKGTKLEKGYAGKEGDPEDKYFRMYLL